MVRWRLLAGGRAASLDASLETTFFAATHAHSAAAKVTATVDTSTIISNALESTSSATATTPTSTTEPQLASWHSRGCLVDDLQRLHELGVVRAVERLEVLV